MHTSLIQILKTGDEQQKTFDGRSYSTQECECLLINDDGTIECVGVLRLSSKFKGENAPKPGTYAAGFALVANPKDRKIGAVITSLTPAGDRVMKPSEPALKAAADKDAKRA